MDKMSCNRMTKNWVTSNSESISLRLSKSLRRTPNSRKIKRRRKRSQKQILQLFNRKLPRTMKKRKMVINRSRKKNLI